MTIIMYTCQVEYNIYSENQTVADTRRGKLFPNVKGCGYPPIVKCDGKLYPEDIIIF